MKITAITPIVARFGNRPRVLVKIETDEGITGWGETYSIGPDLAVGPTVDYCFKLIKGIDPRRIEFIMMKLHQQFRFPPGGIGLSAISGIDHALWDIAGKAAGVPVYQLLGGHARDKVRVYRGIGVKLREHDGDALAGRTIVHWTGKSRWVAHALRKFATPKIMGFSHLPPHDRDLHLALSGLPGANAARS